MFSVEVHSKVLIILHFLGVDKALHFAKPYIGVVKA